jgi:hypothetical protein
VSEGRPRGGAVTTDVHFNFPVRYDTGTFPSVGVAGATVVEVHQSQSRTTLWYHVGRLTGDFVAFGPSHKYDNGIHPACAVNRAGSVVEVHRTQNVFSTGMFCRVGRADAEVKTIDFGDSHEYDTGDVPRVALNDSDVVVEVHEANTPSINMWYHVGRLDAARKRVDFGGSHRYDTGVTPSIALNNQNVVVEVHQAPGLSDNLWYRVGTVDVDRRTISFGGSTKYDTGANPSVALTDDGLVIEVHRSQTFRTLWKRIGTVDVAAKTIRWIGGSVRYADGEWPVVASDGTTAVQVNEDGTTLLYAASQVADRGSWMADHLDLLGDRPLMEVALPASHDAGMSVSRDCVLGSTCNTKTQNLSILGQLLAGSRYFDIRPTIVGGEMFTGHYSLQPVLGALGCNGQSIAEVLDDVVAYLRRGGRDLVILKFSHYLDRDSATDGFDEAQMTRLLDQVTGALEPWLYDEAVPRGGLQSVTLRSYIGSGGKVLAVFDRLSATLKGRYRGVYSYADKGRPGDLVVFDQFSNSNDVDKMMSDQLDKLTNPANHGANLFLLSWTLTQSKGQATGCVTGFGSPILDLAKVADAALWPGLVAAFRQGLITVDRMANLIYTDDFQGTQTDFAIWLNRELFG